MALEDGTLLQGDGGWRISSADSKEISLPPTGQEISLEGLFLEEIRGVRIDWRLDLDTALNAIRIGLGAETAATQGRRVHLLECGTDG